ncbi:MAG: Cys-tRNA(Pro) deacylase [Oligoflexus sp.]
MTLAIRFLKANQVFFIPHFYDYEEKGGTSASAKALGVSEHQVIKTLIMETNQKQPLIVLMHGDQQVSTKELARIIGVKQVTPCQPEIADKHSGYQVGGTSPFGTRKQMPVYMEESILSLEMIYINGGKRGFLIELSPQLAQELLHARLVHIGIASLDSKT